MTSMVVICDTFQRLVGSHWERTRPSSIQNNLANRQTFTIRCLDRSHDTEAGERGRAMIGVFAPVGQFYPIKTIQTLWSDRQKVRQDSGIGAGRGTSRCKHRNL